MSFKEILKSPKSLFPALSRRQLLNWMDDKTYIKIAYRLHMGKKLNLENPVTFNEKLQWLKLHDRKPLYTRLVDKYEVRKYIAEKIGEEYLIPLSGVWDKFNDIDFDKLPDSFVLKCTHDSGGIVICRDKSKLDVKAVREKMNERLKRNYFHGLREWPYKNVKPRIIAEQYMQDRDCPVLNVFKIFNFNSGDKIIQAIQNDKTSKESIDYFDTEWNRLDLRQNFKNSEKPLEKPVTLDKMLELAEILSEGFKFIRTDFYEINGRVYFSEFTFYSDSGLEKFHPPEWDYKLGSRIDLKVKNNKNEHT